MKMTRILILAMLVAFATASLASAGTQVLKNQSTTVSAKIENKTGRSVPAAVKLTGYDDSGNVIGHMCREAYLSAYRPTTLEFAWQAPAYATGVYWSSKVEKYADCPSTDSYVHDDDYHFDSYDHDDDDEHDDGDDHH